MLTLGMYSPRGNAQDITEAAKLRSNDMQPGAIFGSSVDMVEHLAVVGSPSGAFGDQVDQSGATYVFARGGSGWGQQAKLVAGDGAPDEFFGQSVAVSWGDAWDTVVVGNPNSDPDLPGSAYVFVWDGAGWNQQAKLVAGDSKLSQFGKSVAISGDTIVVGADSTDGNVSWSAYVFIRDGEGWSQQAKLVASDASISTSFTELAISVDTIVVGDSGNYGEPASAYVFTRDGRTWTQQAKLTIDNSWSTSVAISGDTAVLGSHEEYIAPGAVEIFVRKGSTWSQQARLTDWDHDMERGWFDVFGQSVDIVGDTVIVGIPGDRPDDEHGDPGSYGALSVYTRNGTNWTHRGKLVGSDTTTRLGAAVSLSGNTALGGDFKHELGEDPEDAVYVFRLPRADGMPGDQP